MFSVLCVDDEPMLLELAKIFLEMTGDFRIDTLTSATAALDTLTRTSYDCIVSDYMMPEMDGIVFLKEVRARGNSAPFIIFTGKGREEVVIEAINSGADFYLQKGGDPKSQFVELAHKIRQAIQIKGAQKTMQDLVQGAPIPEFVIDSNHRIIFWNRALEEYSGIPASDIVGTTNHWKAFYPSQRPCLADLIVDRNVDGITRWYSGKYVKSPIVADNFEATDYFPSIKGGTWLFFTAAPIRDPSGNITGAIETLQDVSSIRKKEEELRAAYEQMQAAFELAKASGEELNIQNKKLEESEQRYRNVVEDQTEFISQFLPDGTHVFVNEAYCRYFNKTRDEIIGKKFRPRIPPEDQRHVREHFASLTKEHPTAIITHQIFLPDGQIGWQRWSDRAIFDENGTLTGYQSVGRDFTEQKRAEIALVQSERRLTGIINFLPDATLVIDRQGKVIAWNKAIEEMTGIPAGDMVGKGDYEYAIPFYGIRRPILIDRIFESDDTIARQYYSIIHQKGALLIAETDLPHLKGRRAVLWAKASPLYDAAGKIIGAVESIRDVTERRQMEDAIRERELQLNSLMESLPIGVFRNTPGPDNTNIMANPVVVHMFGYDTPEEFRKQPMADLFAEPVDLQTISERLIRDGSVSDAEVQLKKKSGELFWARISALAVPGPDGNIAYFDGVLEDSTDRKRVEESLKEANRKLHLLSSITRHDILNKVSILLGNLELAKTKSHDPAMAAYMAKLESAAIAIREQIEFTRVYQDLGAHEPHWHRLDKAILGLQIPRSLSMQVDLPQVEIFADPILEKVFYIFLDNAAMHGQKVTTIKVSAHEVPDGLVVFWEDDGNGIPSEEKERKFTRNFGKHTGLGLFLASEICSVTGITLKETAEPGKGARFEMLVPKGKYRFTGSGKNNPSHKSG